MTFPAAIRTCFRKCVTFSGRASRPEFWWFVLFLFLGSAAAVVTNSIIFGPTVSYTAFEVRSRYGGGWLGWVFWIACFLPLLAATWRRMHDTGRRGYVVFLPILIWFACFYASVLTVVATPQRFSWFAAASLDETFDLQTKFPFIVLGIAGWAAIATSILWLTRKSTPGPNKFGPNPYEAIP